MRRVLALAVAVAACPVAIAVQADPVTAADPPTVTAQWDMNESAGAAVMHDSGPLHLNGSVDPTGVTTGFSYDGATGYHWDRRPPDTLPVAANRIISVPDDPMLDAGAGTFTLEIRYRTKENFGNIIQKGQAHSYGGQWKVQAPHGIPSCLFKGSLGRAATGAVTPINDNAWHTLTCVKTPTSVSLYVDGEFRNQKNRAIGLMDNKKPMTIGGKLECDQIEVTCDYFSGDIDYVSITKPQAGPFLSATIGPKSLVIGEAIDVSGSVTDGATGAPYDNEPIYLFGAPKAGSGYVNWGVQATTNSDGNFSFSFDPKATTDWYVSTAPAGSGVDSDVTHVRVIGKVGIHLHDKSVKSGTRVQFHGKARPSSATVVKLQRKEHGEWVTKKTTGSLPKYSITWKAKSKKDYTWRTKVAGPDFKAAVSKKIVLKVH